MNEQRKQTEHTLRALVCRTLVVEVAAIVGTCAGAPVGTPIGARVGDSAVGAFVLGALVVGGFVLGALVVGGFVVALLVGLSNAHERSSNQANSSIS